VKKICLVTSSRADYGIFKPLVRRLHEDSDIELSLVVTGMHLCPEFGNTYLEIENDGFVIQKKIDIQLSSDAPSAMSKTMSMAMICFADYFQANTPDLLIVLGDRYEIMAVCCAAVNQRIPIAHVHGGETSEGAVDESFRHSITKMSALHFTCCEVYRNRVIQLGEQPDRVYNVGALCVENVQTAPLLSLSALEMELGFSLRGEPYGVVTFHPVTLEDETVKEQMHELVKALDAFSGMRFIITKSNSDAGGREINRIWDDYCVNRTNYYVTESLGMLKYLSAIKHSAVIIGNSSSGILEGPAVKVPTVNIGDRQKGRYMADSIICSPPVASEIIKAINKALSSEFTEISRCAHNPYGDGDTSHNIVSIIKKHLKTGLVVQKTFYNIK
jgi:GDP/UDP-N,N'-diacetylbacillosamine 2-epimerase (hydrolysing)